MSLERNDLNHVLKLSYLDISESEKDQFLPQLQKTLDFMKDLDALDLYGVEPSAHASEQSHYLRADSVVNDADLYLQDNAPSWEARSFSVPKMSGDA